MRDMEALTEKECWDRLRSKRVGRIGFDRGRGARIHPVNYAVKSEALYLTTSRDSELGAFSELFAGGSLVPFEIDQVDDAEFEQWSVLVLGHLDAPAADGAEPRVHDRRPPPPEGHDELLLRLTPVQVTGRRLTDAG